MKCTYETNGAAVLFQSATLMARIVDAAGRCVERAEIASIRYSILEIGVGDIDEAVVVPRHDQVPLEVDAVIHDWLELDGLWTVDGEGYNSGTRSSLSPRQPFRSRIRSTRRFMK